MATLPAATVEVKTEDMTVALLCFEYAYGLLGDRKRAGKLRGYVEATIEANPGITRHGLLLPLGLKVTLPEFVIADQGQQTERLWDE